MAIPTFIRTKGTRIDMGTVLPTPDANGNFNAEAYATPEVTAGLMYVQHTTAAPSPDGTKPIENVETTDKGNIPEPGDETRATLTFGVLATVAEPGDTLGLAAIAAYKAIRAAYTSGAGMVYRRTDPDGKTAKICTVHISSAVEDNPLNGRKVMNVTAIVQGDTFDIVVPASTG